jgi:hypothetical protein
MRVLHCALAAAALLALPACGEEDDHANRQRPAASISVTAAIIDDRINVSPDSFGAGPIRLLVTNQTDSEQAVTLETDEVGGSSGGITRSTGPIGPSSTTTLEVDVREGDYAISVASGDVEPATLKVGAPRPSAQNDLLQP